MSSFLASFSPLLPGDESVLELLEWGAHGIFVLEVLAGDHDAEPAWLGSSELATPLDHPTNLIVKFLPELILRLPGAFSEMSSEVNPSHQSTLGLEKWDFDCLQSILESVFRGGQSLLRGLDESVKPFLVLEDSLKKELGMSGHLVQHTKCGSRGSEDVLVLGIDESDGETVDTEVLTEATGNMDLVLKPSLVSLVALVLLVLLLIEPNLCHRMHFLLLIK